MLNLIKDKITTKKIYEDISILYDVVDINDNCILIKSINTIKELHVYKVEPIMILDYNQSIINNVMTSYMEFLRSMNCDFQIYIENKKVNINNYFKSITLDDTNINKNKLCKIYRDELEKSLNEDNIYVSNYYICVILENKEKIEDINKQIFNLCNSGLVIEKLEGNSYLDNFLYSKINKVDNLC